MPVAVCGRIGPFLAEPAPERTSSRGHAPVQTLAPTRSATGDTLMTSQSQPTFVNGLDMEAAVATIRAITADPSLGGFQFRARNTWVTGGENRSTIPGF